MPHRAAAAERQHVDDVAADNAETRQCRSSAPKTANINPVSTKIRSPSTPSEPIWPIDSAPITPSPPTMTTAPATRERGTRSLQEQRGEQQAAERRAGGLDHAAMAERHEQESGVADQRHHGPAEHHQHQAPAPADAAEIADTGAQHQRQERDPDQRKRCTSRSAGVNPIFRPCRVATKPSAQHSAAPAPQATPSRAGFACDGRAGNLPLPSGSFIADD